LQLLLFIAVPISAIGSRKPIASDEPPAPVSSGTKPAKKSSQPLPRHWYTLELDVGCRYVKLIEDPQYSTEVIPMYDLAYLSPPPSAQVRRIPDIATKLNEPNLMQSETRIVAEGISQPNDVGVLPAGTLGGQSENVWWIAAGNTASTSTSARGGSPGQVYMLDMTKSAFNPVPLTSTPGFGYTHIEWEDMDLDSHPDAIAIRAKSTGSELVWLQQPPSNTPWQAHVIDEEVGANQFKTMWIDDGDFKRLLIICAGSRQGQLIIFWVDDPDNDWSRTSKIMKTIIGKEGAYINIEIVDVNNDGRLDILTSVSGFRGQPGKVICYEVPDNAAFYKGTWKKHILSSSFPPTENYRRISPGGVYAFYPGKSTKEKPSIIVSGADDGRVYLLRPQSWSQYIWHYSTDVILHREGSSIGVPAVGDVDGDGNVEVFVPEKNFIHVLTYAGTEKQGGDGRQGGNRRDHGHTTRVSTAVIILFSLVRMFL